jgi:hypothetical protein
MQQISPRPRLLSMQTLHGAKTPRLVFLETLLENSCARYDVLRHRRRSTDRLLEQARTEIRVVQELMRHERGFTPSTSSSQREWNHAGQ